MTAKQKDRMSARGRGVKMGVISGRSASWPRGSTSLRSESRHGRPPLASVESSSRTSPPSTPAPAGHHNRAPASAFGLTRSRHAGAGLDGPDEPQAGLIGAAVACRRGQPVPGSWGGRYHTDVHPGTLQATVKWPHAARAGSAARAAAQWHRSHDTKTRPGPHSCPLTHRAG
jgi:hypothetical protein